MAVRKEEFTVVGWKLHVEFSMADYRRLNG